MRMTLVVVAAVIPVTGRTVTCTQNAITAVVVASAAIPSTIVPAAAVPSTAGITITIRARPIGVAVAIVDGRGGDRSCSRSFAEVIGDDEHLLTLGFAGQSFCENPYALGGVETNRLWHFGRIGGFCYRGHQLDDLGVARLRRTQILAGACSASDTRGERRTDAQ